MLSKAVQSSLCRCVRSSVLVFIRPYASTRPSVCMQFLSVQRYCLLALHIYLSVFLDSFIAPHPISKPPCGNRGARACSGNLLQDIQSIVRGELKRVEREIVPSRAPTHTWLLTCVPYHARNQQRCVVARGADRRPPIVYRAEGVVVTTLNITEVKLAQVSVWCACECACVRVCLSKCVCGW